MKKLRSAKGLTMISLVITIIVMLILTGVVLNSVVGERSVIKQASDAKTKQEEAAAVEEMNLMLASINAEVLSGSDDKSAEDIAAIFDEKITSEEDLKKSDNDLLSSKFPKVLYFGDYYLVGYNDQYFKVKKSTDPNTKGQFYVDEYISTNLAENLPGGSYIVTEKNADDAGKLLFQNGSSYTVLDKISAREFNFVIPSANGNEENAVNLYLTEDMEIDNILTEEEKASGMKGRSAIDLEKGAILNLYISNNAEIVVNSTYGIDGVEANKLGAEGGPGGFAGIHVPVGATLNVYGDGKLIAYGGDAGDGGGAVSGNTGGGGGGGAGAGIGGNGGNGGKAGTTFSFPGGIGELTNSGEDGGSGETCGNVNFYGTTEIFAYGGAGGSGGSRNDTNNSGAGAGGYPAAGIGGGGAGGGGGEHACSAGGYSAGSGENDIIVGVNGMGSTGGISRKGAGGGYYSKGSELSGVQAFFGQGGLWCDPNNVYFRDYAGSGGIAGNGGTITYSDLSKVHAYNGDMITDGNYASTYYEYDIDGNKTSKIMSIVTKPNGGKIIPAIIFAQQGTAREVYKTNQHMTQDECNKYGIALHTKVNKPINVLIRKRNENVDTTVYGQGIGSGAGYIENNNGVLKKITN